MTAISNATAPHFIAVTREKETWFSDIKSGRESARLAAMPFSMIEAARTALCGGLQHPRLTLSLSRNSLQHGYYRCSTPLCVSSIKSRHLIRPAGYQFKGLDRREP